MNLTDKGLLKKVKALRSVERKTQAELLEHLEEVHQRRLYADLGYSSLFKYLVKELGYSEGAAGRRLGALRLIQKRPKTKELIKTGELSLSVAAETQRFCFKRNKKETDQVIQKVKNKSQDEAKLEFLKISPSDSAKSPEVRQRVSLDTTRLHINVSNKVLTKLEKIKAIKKLSTEDTLEYLLEKELNEIESNLCSTRRSRGTKGRTIPSSIKKELRKRAGHKCEYPGCNEIRHLEVEHIIPFAKGGDHCINNLKLYCRAHNQRAAILEFGQQKMNQYIN